MPYLEYLAVSREHKPLLLLEGNGVDGKAIVVVLYSVGAGGA